MDEVNWQAVNEFARRTLWNRVWIVQEVSLAKRAVVLCGPERMLLEDLYVFRKLRIALFAEATTATAQKQHGRHRFLAVLASSIGHVSIFMDLRMALQSLKTTVSNNSMAVLEFTTETSFDLGTTPIVNNFSYLLRTLSSFQATGARDHVYGLLGLYSRLIPSQRDPVIPDYSIPASVVYRSLIRRHVEATNDVSICALNGISVPST